MCIAPSFVWQLVGPKWEKIPTACRKCWRCRSNRINDYTGRALCEASLSTATVALTLTYAPRSDLAEKEITPNHFQDFIRSLRKRGHSVRYIATAEKGGLHGRVHFHAVLFFRDNPPDMPNKQNFHMAEWPHGHVYADHDADEKALRYICKYILKEGAYGPHKPKQHWFTLSKKPTLGWAFFEEKALNLFSLGLMPSSFNYLPPGGNKGRSYFMTGATRRDYLRLLKRLYAAKGIDRKTLNEWVLKSLEKADLFDLRLAFQESADLVAFADDLAERQAHYSRVQKILFDIATRQGLRITEERLDREWNLWLADRDAQATVRRNV